MAATPFPGLPPLFIVLGDDERLSVHPIGVTQHAQRADLELISKNGSPVALEYQPIENKSLGTIGNIKSIQFQ